MESSTSNHSLNSLSRSSSQFKRSHSNDSIKLLEIVKAESIVYFDINEKMLHNITIIYEFQHLGYSTIVQIIEQCKDVVQKYYLDITVKNREQRRKEMHNNKANYIDLVNQYITELNVSLGLAQEKLCQALGIDETVYQESVLHHLNNGKCEHFFDLQSKLRKLLKVGLFKNAQQDVDVSQVLVILKELFLDGNQPKEIEPGMSWEVKNIIFHDYIYDIFRLEEEDIIHLLSDEQQDQLLASIMHVI
ncbi:hypothetical protein pb186bvf_016854 [Paramecium bursaria]